MQEAGRQAAHVLLDMVSVFDPALGDDATNTAAVNLAFQRLNEVGAVTADFNEETHELNLNMTNLLGATSVLTTWLVRQLEVHTGVSREEVIAGAREFMDGVD